MSARYALRAMRPRDPEESPRPASSLELFFDLVFVVAVSLASTDLAHLLEEGHVYDGVLAYAMVFFAIWWAWMNFTWFATAFDTDDWLYRVTTFVQMAGVLVLAAGVDGAMNESDFTLVVVGYVIMRMAMVSQWLRVMRNSPEFRSTALNYAIGISVVQILWIFRSFLPAELGVLSFAILVLAEISIPILAERRHKTPYHPEHIAERYGLFTLIVLGESLLASANAIIEAINENERLVPLLVLSGSTLIVVAAMWWIYFSVSQDDSLSEFQGAIVFGYTHYIIFAAAGAVSSGIEVALVYITHHGELGSIGAAAAITVPVGLFVFATWALAIRPRASGIVNAVIPAGAGLIVASTFVPQSVGVTAVILVLIVAALVVRPPVGALK